MARQITEKLREQWRLATRKYREKRRENGLKLAWIKEKYVKKQQK